MPNDENWLFVFVLNDWQWLIKRRKTSAQSSMKRLFFTPLYVFSSFFFHGIIYNLLWVLFFCPTVSISMNQTPLSGRGGVKFRHGGDARLVIFYPCGPKLFPNILTGRQCSSYRIKRRGYHFENVVRNKRSSRRRGNGGFCRMASGAQ